MMRGARGRPLDRRSFFGLALAGALSRWVDAYETSGTMPRQQTLLKVALNGGRAAGSHPALPVTPEAAARSAREAVEAGAGAVHVHVRGPDGDESVRAEDVERFISVLRAAVPGTPVGVSTHFRIVNDEGLRYALVAEWSVRPDFASVNFNEPGAARLAELLMEQGVGVEAGLFDSAATQTCVETGLASRCLRLMFEPRGAELSDVLSSVAQMEAVLDAADVERPRLLHGFGALSWPLIEEATRRGYQTRAGLEDTLQLPDGSQAPNNAAIVAEAARRIAAVREGRAGE